MAGGVVGAETLLLGLLLLELLAGAGAAAARGVSNLEDVSKRGMRGEMLDRT